MAKTKIENIEHLKQVLSESEEITELVIVLNGGMRSRYLLSYDGESIFWLTSLVDDTEQVLTEEQLLNEDYTNIGKAMENGALYLDEE